MALHRNIKKTLLHTFYYANNKITCIRCNTSGKFVSIKKYLAKQKANVILSNAKASNAKASNAKASNAKASNAKASNAKASKLSNELLSITIMLMFVVVAYVLCFDTIVERQQQYNSVNSSIELLNNYYADCSTDSECEVLESELNFDFKKGMN